jgi:hypothetical protein
MIPFSPILTNPQLKDLMDVVKRDILLSINCVALATIENVNFSDQTVQAKINYQRTYYQQNGAGNFVPMNYDYPILSDVPFFIIGGGKGNLTFPIAKGDECILLFNDRDLDNWFNGATTGPVATGRLHSLSDALALVGVARSVTVDAANVVLSNGTTVLGLQASVINMTNGSITLGTVLKDIVSALSSLNSTLVSAFGGPTPSTGMPLSPAAVSALSSLTSTITSLNTTIGGLLL